MRRHRRSGSTTALLVAVLAVIVCGLAFSAANGSETEADRGVVAPTGEPASTATTFTVSPGYQSDPLTEYTRYSQTFGTPCNPLLDICPE